MVARVPCSVMGGSPDEARNLCHASVDAIFVKTLVKRLRGKSMDRRKWQKDTRQIAILSTLGLDAKFKRSVQKTTSKRRHMTPGR